MGVSYVFDFQAQMNQQLTQLTGNAPFMDSTIMDSNIWNIAGLYGHLPSAVSNPAVAAKPALDEVSWLRNRVDEICWKG